MASKRLIITTALLVAGSVGGWGARWSIAEQPTAAQALALTPMQPNVEYATVSKEEAAQCTIRAEQENGVTAWVVRNPQGEILRRFADTNADNVVDQWCYFQNGLEVYRDIDSNFNGKADQYRWFNTAGTRWGTDTKSDGRIDNWKVISPHEVAEQVVLALKTRDPARFGLVLLTPEELSELGFGKARAEQIAEKIKAAPAGFSKIMAEQKIVTPQTRFVDFGGARPGTIPAGSAGSTKDVTVIDNAAALVETGGKHEQVFLGTLVAVGQTWKLIDLPTVGTDNQPQDGGFIFAPLAQAQVGGDNAAAPSDEMQKLLSRLEQLDRQAANLPPEKQAANVEERAGVLQRLADIAPERDRDQWYRQLAGMISVAIQSGGYPKGGERLERLQKRLADAGASKDLLAHVAFQRMWADYVVNQSQPEANVAKLQEQWLKDLEAFVGQYPQSPDAAEALLQLGMYQEFVGKTDEATTWYQQLVKTFPKADQAAKANGALRRLTSVGKPIRLRGNEIQGGQIDISARPYSGKVVLIHYWATWCGPCKDDMVKLKEIYAKRGGAEFEIIGVCLDDTPGAPKQFLAQNRFSWKHLHEPGGLDGRLANEMGVMTLPLMILVDQRGNVVHHNIHLGTELETELNRLLKPAGGTANTPRGGERR